MAAPNTKFTNVQVTGTLQVDGASTLTGAIAPGAINPTGDISLATGKQTRNKGGTGTCVSNAVTISQQTGRITTEALSTAAAATQAITLTNTLIAATTQILCQITGGSYTAGIPIVEKAVPGSGSAVLTLRNVAAAAGLNGTVIIDFQINNPT